MLESILGGGLIVVGIVLLVLSLNTLNQDSYKPRHTRSTYLPPKR